MKILISDPIDNSAIKSLQSESLEVTYKPEITPEEIAKEIYDFDILIVRSRTKVTADILQNAHKLKLIGRVGTGTDNIDKKTAFEKNITIINAPGANAQAVAELTLGLMLSMLRTIPQAVASTKRGEWRKKEFKGEELCGKTVGIIGFGAIGKKVGKLVEIFGAHVLKHDKDDDEANLENLMSVANIISIHTILVDATRGLINKKLLSKMNKSALLINCARAQIIVEDDLYKAIVNKNIAGAALDVLWQEPITPASKWTTLDNVLITPHIGGQTFEASLQAIHMIVSDIIRFTRGETPLNIVT